MELDLASERTPTTASGYLPDPDRLSYHSHHSSLDAAGAAALAAGGASGLGGIATSPLSSLDLPEGLPPRGGSATSSHGGCSGGGLQSLGPGWAAQQGSPGAQPPPPQHPLFDPVPLYEPVSPVSNHAHSDLSPLGADAGDCLSPRWRPSGDAACDVLPLSPTHHHPEPEQCEGAGGSQSMHMRRRASRLGVCLQRLSAPPPPQCSCSAL